MPPIEVHRNLEKTFTKKGSNAEKLSGILKINDPRIIEEIADLDLLA